MRIAVLITTFNRKDKTLTCLEALNRQAFGSNIRMDIFLTDDNSSDGTAEAVLKSYPFVKVFHGTGHLYWAGGMRYTWNKAVQGNYDFYLLLNDDTILFDNAVQSLVDGFYSNSIAPESAICIGSTQDPNTGILSYGGNALYRSKLWKSRVVFDAKKYVSCDFANANIMLVPKVIVERVGILSNLYTHSLADYDYTLRAKQAGFGIVLIPGFMGTCVDDHGNNWKSQKSSLKERIKFLRSPKGLAYSEYMKFIKLHFPSSYFPELGKIWLKTFFPFIWDNFKKKPAQVTE